MPSELSELLKQQIAQAIKDGENLSGPVTNKPESDGTLTRGNVLLLANRLNITEDAERDRQKRAGIFNFRVDYPMLSVIHALEHDLNSEGIYNIGLDARYLCPYQDDCLVPTPEEFVILLDQLRLSRLGRKAILAGNIKNGARLPGTCQDRPQGHYVLSIDRQTSMIDVYMSRRYRLFCDAKIFISEPWDSSNIVMTKTSIALQTGSNTKDIVLNSPLFPATAATILDQVLGQVTI